MTVCIDPGHGGKDSGATGSFNGLYESHAVLNIGLKVRDFLSGQLKVVMTRDGDEFVSLSDRCKIANRLADCEIYVSLHLNSASNKSAHGFEVFTSGSEKSRKLASSVYFSHSEKNPLQKSRGVKNGTFYVLKNTRMPAILWEGGFLSNELENVWLTDEEIQTTLARGIADGILAYFGLEKKESNLQLTLEQRVDRIEKQLNIS